MSQPSLFSLPLELLEDIADIVQLDTQLSLCRVSKPFHSLAIRSVYRDIALCSPTTLVACCRTLSNNPHAAAAVRSFSITYTPSLPLNAHYFPSFYLIIGQALRSLLLLQDLQLMVSDPNYIQALNTCQLPSLRHFECYLALTDSLILFLNRHPDIYYLQIAPNEDLTPSPLPASGAANQVVLPKLEYFVGNSECVSALVCDASLRAAFVFWDAVDGKPQDAIKALERSSGDTINVLSCQRRGWNLDLIELISIWLPNIYMLSITNILIVDTHPSQAYLDAIGNILSRFTSLRHLHLTCVDTYQMGSIECRLDDDFNTVTAWGSKCPSLSECMLPHSDGLKWIRILDNLWLPDPSDRRGVKWLWSTLYSKRYPQLNKVVVAVDKRIRKKNARSGGFEGTIEGLRQLTLRGEWDNQETELPSVSYGEMAFETAGGGAEAMPGDVLGRGGQGIWIGLEGETPG